MKLKGYRIVHICRTPLWIAAGFICFGVAAQTRAYITPTLYIDTSTVHRERQAGEFIIRYLLIESDTHAYAPGYARYVDADCLTRRRIENISAQPPSEEWRSVFDGTRQSKELDIACSVAGYVPPVATAPLPQPTPSPSPQPNAKGSVPSVRPKSSGTAFVVASGILVTNKHVIENCTSLVVVNNKIGVRVAHTMAVDDSLDLAALSAPELKELPIPLYSVAADLGARVVVMGYPLTDVLGVDVRLTTGVVSSLSGVAGDSRNMQISAAVQPGNSGGPVIDETGAVTGVVVAKLAKRFEAENVSFAVRGPALKSFLELNGIRYQQTRQKTQISIAETARRARSSTVMVLCY